MALYQIVNFLNSTADTFTSVAVPLLYPDPDSQTTSAIRLTYTVRPDQPSDDLIYQAAAQVPNKE